MIEHLSFSSLNTWLLCPRSWRLHYLEEVRPPVSPALVFGSAFHETVEAHIAKKDEMPLATRWCKCWAEQLEQEVAWDKPTEFYEDLGVAMLSSPTIVESIESIEPFFTGENPTIESRVELQVPGVEVPIIGFVDLIEADGIPCDIKTAARAWNQGKADGDLQPTVYLAALNQQGYTSPDWRFRYRIFTKNMKNPKAQVLETRRTAKDLFWMFTMVQEIWAAIQAGSFPPNNTSFKCSPKWCQFWDICRGS